MKLCNKCGESFPCQLKIDSKWRNLSSRKFCLKCSPFGKHNTKNLNKSNEACRPYSNGKRASYSEWSESAKNDNRARIYWRGIFRKQYLIDKKGGKCEKCGYDKCLRSLSFHHLDRNEKKFSLDSRTIQTKEWSLVKEEAKKCSLLCLNCHMELESSFSVKYENYKDKFNKNLE